MANYANANLVTAQAKLLAAMQAGELRFTQPKVYKKFLENSKIMFPDYQTLRTREDRVIEANYVTRASRSLGSARVHNPSGSVGASAIITPSWTTYTDLFAYTLKQANKSIYSLDEMIIAEFKNVIANMAEGLETAATAYLFAHRSTVNAASIEGTYNASQYSFEIEDKNEDRAIQITKTVMDINKYSGQYIVFCDSIAYNKFEKYAAQGAANSSNLSFQFGGVEFVHAVNLYALAAALGTPYTLGSWVAVPVGMIGALPHIPKENKMGIPTTVCKYSTIVNPVDMLPYAVFETETAQNGTSTGGYTQDVATNVEVSIDVAFEHAPLTSGSPIQMFSLVPTIVG